MTLTMQIALGSVFLSLSALFHVAAVAASIPLFKRLSDRFHDTHMIARNSVVIGFGLMIIVFAHTVEIWLWAGVYYRVGAFSDFEAAFYFATVTYTTLGYGDLVLGPGMRVFATFGAITGLLTFGISTAMLIGLVGQLLPLNPNNTHRHRD